MKTIAAGASILMLITSLSLPAQTAGGQVTVTTSQLTISGTGATSQGQPQAVKLIVTSPKMTATGMGNHDAQGSTFSSIRIATAGLTATGMSISSVTLSYTVKVIVTSSALVATGRSSLSALKPSLSRLTITTSGLKATGTQDN